MSSNSYRGRNYPRLIPSPTLRPRRSRSRSPSRRNPDRRDRRIEDRYHHYRKDSYSESQYERRGSRNDRWTDHRERGHSRHASWARSASSPSATNEGRDSARSPTGVTKTGRSSPSPPQVEEISSSKPSGGAEKNSTNYSQLCSTAMEAPITPLRPGDGETHSPGQGFPIPESLTKTSEDVRKLEKRIDNELRQRTVTEKEAAFIHGLWSRRVSSLAQIHEILTKKEDIEALLADVKSVGTTLASSDNFSSVINRLEKQSQQADEIVQSLFNEFLDREMNISDMSTPDESTTVHLHSLKRAIDDLRERSEELLNKAPPTALSVPSTSRSPPEGLPADEMTPIQLEELNGRIGRLEDELDELSIGLDDDFLEEQVRKRLDKLKAQGRFDTHLVSPLTDEEKSLLVQYETELKEAEAWVAKLDLESEERHHATGEWWASFHQISDAVSRAEETLEGAKKQLQSAETRLRKTIQTGTLNDEARVNSLARRVCAEARAEVEQIWQKKLEETSRLSRQAIDKSMDEFRARLEEDMNEVSTVWPRKEREIIIEMRRGLEETVEWQEAVIEWLQAGNRGPDQMR